MRKEKCQGEVSTPGLMRECRGQKADVLFPTQWQLEKSHWDHVTDSQLGHLEIDLQAEWILVILKELGGGGNWNPGGWPQARDHLLSLLPCTWTPIMRRVEAGLGESTCTVCGLVSVLGLGYVSGTLQMSFSSLFQTSINKKTKALQSWTTFPEDSTAATER